MKRFGLLLLMLLLWQGAGAVLAVEFFQGVYEFENYVGKPEITYTGTWTDSCTTFRCYRQTTSTSAHAQFNLDDSICSLAVNGASNNTTVGFSIDVSTGAGLQSNPDFVGNPNIGFYWATVDLQTISGDMSVDIYLNGAGSLILDSFVAFQCGVDQYPLTVTPQPSSTPAPTATPRPTDTPAFTATPQPTTTPRPTDTPAFTATPQPTTTPRPTDTPAFTATPQPTWTHAPYMTVYPTPTPINTPVDTPTEINTPVDTPTEINTPVDTPTAINIDATIEALLTALCCGGATPLPTWTAAPSVTPAPTATPQPTATPIGFIWALNPAQQFVDIDGHPASLTFSISAGDAGLFSLLIAIFLMLVLTLGVQLWRR